MATVAITTTGSFIDSNVEVIIPPFDNTKANSFPSGQQFSEGNAVYENVLSTTIPVVPYDILNLDYVKGDLAFKGDGETPEIDRVHICIGDADTDIPKTPSDYTTGVDTDYDETTWEDRYMQFLDPATTYDFDSGCVNTYAANTVGFCLSTDGTKMFEFNNDTDRVYEYDLSTARDIFSRTYSGNSFYLGADNRGINISPDGSKLYLITEGGDDYIRQYSLSPVNTLTGITYQGKKEIHDLVTFDIIFNDDGSKFYASATDLGSYPLYKRTAVIHQYSLTIPYDILGGRSLDEVIAFDDNEYYYNNTYAFNDDGSLLYRMVLGKILAYDLSTEYDVRTKTLSPITCTVPCAVTSNMRFSPDGFILYTGLKTNICQCMLATAFDVRTRVQEGALTPSYSVVRNDIQYTYRITETNGIYTFTSGVQTLTPLGDLVEESFVGMQVYDALTVDSIEPEAIIGSHGTWLAKTYIRTPEGNFIRTNVNAPIEYFTDTKPAFSILTLISSVNGFTYIKASNPYRPFDTANITAAVKAESPMYYKVRGDEEFNSFTLAKVLGESVTYSFIYPIDHSDYDLWLDGEEVGSGGNGVVKTATTDIDCRRDANGTLSLYPTTVIFYADRQMPTGSYITVSIIRENGGVMELGTLTLNNAIIGGFTNMEFTHSIQDFNDYTPDAWGNIPEAIKAVVTKFNITVDIYLEHYDHCVALNESIAGKYVTIDASDSDGEATDSLNVFASLIRRVRITSATSKSIVKDGELWRMAGFNISVQEIV